MLEACNSKAVGQHVEELKVQYLPLRCREEEGEGHLKLKY